MNYARLDSKLDQMIDKNCAKDGADFDYGLHILLCHEQSTWIKDCLIPQTTWVNEGTFIVRGKEI